MDTSTVSEWDTSGDVKKADDIRVTMDVTVRIVIGNGAFQSETIKEKEVIPLDINWQTATAKDTKSGGLYSAVIIKINPNQPPMPNIDNATQKAIPPEFSK